MDHRNGRSVITQLVTRACGAAAMAFVFGLCLGRILKAAHDPLSIAGAILCGALLIVVLFWTRQTAWRSVTGEAARKSARAFLWSCVSFSILTFTFGIFVSGLIWYLHDFIGSFGAIWFGALTSIAIFLVRRDAKRITG